MRIQTLVHTAKDGNEVIVLSGTKSQYDFRLRFRKPGTRLRKPRHLHLIVDLYMKWTGNSKLTDRLVEELVEMSRKVRPSKTYPPKLKFFSERDEKRYAELNKYGEFSVDFIMIVAELLVLQEKTTYSTGSLNLDLWEKFVGGEDIFNVVSAANAGATTFR